MIRERERYDDAFFAVMILFSFIAQRNWFSTTAGLQSKNTLLRTTLKIILLSTELFNYTVKLC